MVCIRDDVLREGGGDFRHTLTERDSELTSTKAHWREGPVFAERSYGAVH